MRSYLVFPVLVIAALCWFLFFSQVGSDWIAGRLMPPDNRPVVGRVVSAQGSFKRIHGGLVVEYNAPLSDPLSIHDGDRLETNSASTLLLILNSQDELEVGELAAVAINLWQVSDANSPIYLNLTVGELTSRKAGVRGKAYVVRDGRLYFPGQKPVDKPLALTVSKSVPQELQLADSADAPNLDFEADTQADESQGSLKGSGVAQSPTAAADPQTLSNEYIDEMIASRQGLLQKCWLTRLKENPSLRGQLTVQFEITRRGKVRDLAVTDSSIEDDILKRCVISVIERIGFRPFKGAEISVSYPITFE